MHIYILSEAFTDGRREVIGEAKSRGIFAVDLSIRLYFAFRKKVKCSVFQKIRKVDK